MAAGAVAFSVVFFVGWLTEKRPGKGAGIAVIWPSTNQEGAEALASVGVVDGSLFFRVLLGVSSPFVKPVRGAHLLTDDLTPVEVLRRLGRLSSRSRVDVLIPEGFNRFQIGERLDAMRVCGKAAWATAVMDKATLSRLSIPGDSAEGYLFPAKYDLFLDSDPTALVTQFVVESRKRYAAVRARHADAVTSLEQKLGFHDHEVITLASVVQREAAKADELPLVASVFLNRLSDPTFKPARSLQSDPTAAYGCLVQPELASCASPDGRVTPEMLRDVENPYNTYRHPGLPKGPISNPGVLAVEAVLAPATTDFLFFVARGDGRHTFSRTLEEHEKAIPKAR
jgi:UPF0755 protein